MGIENLINADPGAKWVTLSGEELENLRHIIQTELENLGPELAVEFVEQSQYRDEMREAYPVGSDISKRIELDIVRGKAPNCWLASVVRAGMMLGLKTPTILMYPPEID